MQTSKVAIRYAQALLDLAVENNNLENVSRDMDYLAQVNNENRDFQLLLSSPVIRADKKIAVLNEIFGQFESVSSSFIALIAKNGREALLPQIAEAYKALLKEKKGIVSVTIVSAVKLDDSVKKQIIEKIQATTKGTLEITEETDPSLIGGFIVKMGDTQIDASVSSKLDQLKQRLTR
jgi:F-type H+-transporting ATPase subunit delta